MTDTVRHDDKRELSARRGLSSLQKALFGVLALFFAINALFWFLEYRVGVSHAVASTTCVLFVVGCFLLALALPWLRLPGRRDHTKAERLGAMVIVWVFIALIPRFIWELPWLLFFDQIREGVESGSFWTYMWSPILLGGDARYLNGDPLIVVLEWVALFVGFFEAYALVQFFRNGKRFTSTQLSLIMAGMIVEVTLPAVYFGVEIANNLESMSSPVEMWVKFVVINVLWCTMPLVTYFWGVRRLTRQDLTVKF
ncbi:Emopamil binding protein [Mycolicibacterium aurum]|uniref:Emopamil binding protein n=1 Tax=Mycolicibacterium aurum TaxID=1791 RepID=A0A448IFS3_MYCAU|nr:membrane protein [Mycolicibacterium aurum]VEG51198.1 Emopamil binding protein [Mycolicibacterium aurum]